VVKKEQTPKIFEAEIGLRLRDRIILVKRTTKDLPTFILDDKTSSKNHTEVQIDTEKKFNHLWNFLQNLKTEV